MGTFIQLVIDGLSTGSIYAALALAIVLVNQATGLINFAQGGMAVLAAYVAWWLTTQGVPLVLAILLSIVFSFVLGAVVERWLMRRFERGDPDTAVVVTIGLLTLITGIAGWLWTYNNQQFPSLFSLDTVSFLGVSVSQRSIGTTVVIVVVVVLLQVLFVRTKLGLAPSTAKNVYDAIRRLRVESGIAMVVVEQNANLAFTLVDSATVLETGRNVLTGSSAELKGMDEIRRAYLGG